jgi:Na+-driven multidrug efflux pump
MNNSLDPVIKSNPALYKFLLYSCMIIYIVSLLFGIVGLVLYNTERISMNIKHTTLTSSISLLILGIIYLYIFISNYKNPVNGVITRLVSADIFAIVIFALIIYAFKNNL